MKERSPKGRRVAGIYLALLLASLLVACGGGKSDSEKALEVARNWVDSNTDAAAEEIVKLVIGEVPIVSALAGNVIAGEINRRITWSYAEPQNTSGSLYRVDVTASVEPKFDVPLLGSKTYEIKLPFDLRIDVSSGEVTRWSPDLTGASVTEKP